LTDQSSLELGMTEPAKTHQADDSRREAIITAATQIFAEKGFAGASNREIAREAGISPGLIYWYFRDKDDLFREVVTRLFPLSGLEFPSEGADELPIDALLLIVGEQFLRILTSPDILRLMRLALAELMAHPEIWREIGQLISQQVIGKLASQLDIRIQRGMIPPIDTRMAAQAYFGSLVGYVLRKHIYASVDLQETDDQAYLRTVVRIYASGLTSDDAQSSATTASEQTR
jgi:AcrR family transcriptional regulator